MDKLAPKKLIQIGKIHDVTLLAIGMQFEIELLHFGIRYLKAFVDFLTLGLNSRRYIYIKIYRETIRLDFSPNRLRL